MHCKYYAKAESAWLIPYGPKYPTLRNAVPQIFAEYENGVRIGYFSTRHHGANFVYFRDGAYVFFHLKQKSWVDMGLADHPEFHGGVLFLHCELCVAYTMPSETYADEFFSHVENPEIFNGLYARSGIYLLRPIFEIEINIEAYPVDSGSPRCSG